MHMIVYNIRPNIYTRSRKARSLILIMQLSSNRILLTFKFYDKIPLKRCTTRTGPKRSSMCSNSLNYHKAQIFTSSTHDIYAYIK